MAQSEFLQVAANAVNARLVGASKETKLLVSGLLSYEVESKERPNSFRSSSWDGRSSFFDWDTGVFPSGFVQMVGRELSKAGHRVQYASKPMPECLGPEIGTHDPLGYGFSDRYDYQLQTVRQLVKYGRGVAQIATGGGKSNIAVLAVSTIRQPTLFLTTRSVLAYQMKAAFEKAGFVPGFMGDGIFEPRKGVNIAMVQTLIPRLAEDHPKREQTLALLKYFKFVIGEEAHESGGNGYYRIMCECGDALYRLALTATPFMRPDGEANMRLQASFGSLIIQVTEEQLIDRGILATPYFKIAPTRSAPKFLRRGTKWPTCYDLGIIENTERNLDAFSEAVKAVKHGLTVMILVRRPKHGEKLLQMLKEANIRVKLLQGKDDQDVRDKALREMGTGQLDVLIGTSILDVGVDIPAVGLVIILGGGKGEVAFRQEIGRGLREKKSGPNICFILDYEDTSNKTLHEHALTRRAILEATPGFAQRILPPGANFPYEMLAMG